uniref:Ionotropic glutamate receptor C-terminal domain-containing protein n=1 Tax=Daphnia galeata TaxID=27404 RepID=A0A8J2WMH9_9CRUS|nr:unnamed protein product [Daphnia galeata]
MGYLFLFIFSVWLTVLSGSYSTNQLNGQHLRVIWPRWSGNPKGLSGPLKGGVVLEYLSARLNFTYEMVRVTEELEPAVGRGQMNYVIDEQCDLLIQNVLATTRRNQIVDLTLPWVYDSSAFLIPVPDESANINAIVKPFQWPIWLGLGLSIVCVIAVLNMMQYYLDYRYKKETEAINKIQSNTTTKEKGLLRAGDQYLYVYGNLLAQGEQCTSKRLPIRLVAGVWCVASFIFVQAYNSTLFTYVVTPVRHPLINSIYDIFENPEINLLVRTGTIDLLLKRNNNTGVFLKIEKELDSNPNSRCASASDCVRRITPGSTNIYFEASNYLKDAIRTEFLKTGKCHLQLAKEGFTGVTSSFALPKNSPYTQSITQGILQLHQTGIIDYWDLWFRPMPPQCDGKPVKIRKQKSPPGNGKPSRLSLKNLTGAFVILIFGMSLSFLVFLCEKIISMMSKNRRISSSRKSVEESPPLYIENELPPPISNKDSTAEESFNVIQVQVIVESVDDPNDETLLQTPME